MANQNTINPRRMQFSDFLVDLALRVTNDCLRSLSAMTPEVALGPLEDLRNQVARIEACARLFGAKPANKKLQAIIDQCAQFDQLIYVPMQTSLRVNTAADLLNRAKKKKTQKAVLQCSLHANPSQISIVGETEIDLDQCQSILIAQSQTWRHLFNSVLGKEESVEPSKMSQKIFVESYQKSYRKGKKLGQKVVFKNHDKCLAWYHWVRRLRLQLEVMRSALGETNKASRWYLEKLQQNLAEVIALDEFEQFAQKLTKKLNRTDNPVLKSKEFTRIESLCLSRRETLKRRSAKLYQGVYGPKVSEFGNTVSEDLEGLNLDKIVLLPKPTINTANNDDGEKINAEQDG